MALSLPPLLPDLIARTRNASGFRAIARLGWHFSTVTQRKDDADSAICSRRRSPRNPSSAAGASSTSARTSAVSCWRWPGSAPTMRGSSGNSSRRSKRSRLSIVRAHRDSFGRAAGGTRAAGCSPTCTPPGGLRARAGCADRPPAPSTRAGPGGRARPRLARAPRRRCGAGQDDTGGIDHRGAAGARTGGPGPHRHAVRASRSVAHRAGGSLRHRRRRRRLPRDSPAMPDGAGRTESLDHDADRHHLDRLRETAGGPAIGARLPVGRGGRRRSARRGARQRSAWPPCRRSRRERRTSCCSRRRRTTAILARLRRCAASARSAIRCWCSGARKPR